VEQLPDLTTILLNYGAMGACLIFFMWKDITITKKLNDSLDKMSKDMTILIDRVGIKEVE
jgi:hypothetical protein